MIKPIGKKFGRALHFDFHTSPGIENIFKNFDAEHFASQLADAHVDYVNITARCNMGYSYYNTKVGKKYAGLGERDPFAEILDACHKRGIGVTAYINVGLDHDFAADNYNWLKVDRNGRIYRDDKKSNFFRNMCFNSPYRAHFLEEIKEICQYDIDGLFCDCFALNECFCPVCMEDMKKRGVDATNIDAVMEYQNNIRLEFAKEIYEATGDKKDKIKLYFNGLSWTADNQSHAEIECLTSDTHWGFDYFDSIAAYARTIYDDCVYMSGRFQISWGDFGGIKSVASMQNDLYDAMMNGYGISYGDHMHPVDGFENEVVSRIKEVMEEKIPYEPYTDNAKNVTEIGVIIKSNNTTRRVPYFVKGVSRILKELKLLYNVYDENGDFEKARLVIIGENGDFDDNFKARLKAYIEKGGKAIFTGSAIDLGYEIGALDFIELVGKDTGDNAYYTTDKSDFRVAMYEPSRVIKNICGKETANYVSRVLNFTWDGRQSCFYRPQGEKTEYSAAVVGKNCACICFDIFKAYIDNFFIEHRELFGSVVDGLLDNKLIQSEKMPKTATAAITKNDEHTVLHIKSTYPEHKGSRGIIEDHVYMKSVPVSVMGEYKKVYILPEMTEVECKWENGRTTFETGDILGYRAFLLK